MEIVAEYIAEPTSYEPVNGRDATPVEMAEQDLPVDRIVEILHWLDDQKDEVVPDGFCEVKIFPVGDEDG